MEGEARQDRACRAGWSIYPLVGLGHRRGQKGVRQFTEKLEVGDTVEVTSGRYAGRLIVVDKISGGCVRGYLVETTLEDLASAIAYVGDGEGPSVYVRAPVSKVKKVPSSPSS